MTKVVKVVELFDQQEDYLGYRIVIDQATFLSEMHETITGEIIRLEKQDDDSISFVVNGYEITTGAYMESESLNEVKERSFSLNSEDVFYVLDNILEYISATEGRIFRIFNKKFPA